MAWATDAPLLAAGFTRSFGDAQLAKRLVYTYMAAAGLDQTWSGTSVTASGAIQGATIEGTASVTAPTIQTSVAATPRFSAAVDGSDVAIAWYGDATTNLTISVGQTSHIWTFTHATGELSWVLPANLSDAWSITDGTNDYVVFTTTTGGALVTLGSTAVGVRTQRVESIPDATTSETVTVADSGRVYVQLDADEAVTFQLPATQNGLIYTFVCGNAGGEINISPNASDKITGKGLAGADNQDIKNTNASNAVGDCITLVGDGADGWIVINMLGTWALV